MSRRIVAVVQARCESERLRDKVLARLAGKTVIEHVLAAIRASALIDDVILATTGSTKDDRLAELGARARVRVFRGSELDVLGRFVAALVGDPADVVVRHTGDDPLLDPFVIDTVVGSFLKGDCDYASNIIERTWPRGLDTEVFSRAGLDKSNVEGSRPEDREHVTIFIRTHPEAFVLRNVRALPQETWPDLRLCIDTVEDRALLEAVFDQMYEPGKILRVGTVVEWLRRNPEICKLNSSVAQKPTLGKIF